MLAARWADEHGPSENHTFETNGTTSTGLSNLPVSQTTSNLLPPSPANILMALAENERIVRSKALAEQRAVALAWLFHLVSDVHHPLHTVQLFTREYPYGDRGGNEICVRVAPGRPPLDLHRLWDGLMTSTNNAVNLSKIATELLSKFSRVRFRELDHTHSGKDGRKKATRLRERLLTRMGVCGERRKGQARDCREVRDANFLSRGYPGRAKLIADRRVYLAGYRLAELLERSF